MKLQLRRTDGVTAYEVSLEKTEAQVRYDGLHGYRLATEGREVRVGTCCRDEPAQAETPERCPKCKRKGTRVDGITPKALLRPTRLAAVEESGYRFCATSHCPVVYFGRGGSFGREDLSVGVFQKEPVGSRTVCYCLSITEAELARDVAAQGRSTARDRIVALVKAGRCACDLRNPQGSCCLGNVDAVVRIARAVPGSTLDPQAADQQ